MTHDLQAAPAPDSAWEELWRQYRRQHPAASLKAFREHVAQACVLLSDLKLDAALRVVSHGESLPPPGPAADLSQRTAALQDIIDRLVALTMEDGLTGLFNRRYFDRRLFQELQRSSREQRPCSVCIVDADDFKRVNDMHGHAAGDLVLKEVARAISEVLRTTDDVTSRLGGEEFAVILPSTDAAGGVRAAERVRERIAALRVQYGATELRVTVSIGVATFDPRRASTASELVNAADTALYVAKAAGKNTVRLAETGAVATSRDGVTESEKDALLL